MQTAGNHSAVPTLTKEGALPVMELILFRRKMHISTLTVGCRCICEWQDEIVRRLRSQDSSEEHSLVFLMCCALKALRT